jgi:putative spermidine/putrescine transport system permease protein
MGKLVRSVALLSLVYISLPTLIIVLASFSAAERLEFPPSGLSFSPYFELFSGSTLRRALIRSLIVGVESVGLSLLVGIPAALALHKHRLKARTLLHGYLALGFTTPLIVSALAFLVLYFRLGLIGELWPISVAITVVVLPFLLFSMASSILALNPELEDASATLGADSIQTFMFVTLPGIMPGILTGALLVFVMAITDFIIGLILSTTANATLPVVIFGSIRGALRPILAAAGGIYIGIACIVITIINRTRSLDQFLYRAD